MSKLISHSRSSSSGDELRYGDVLFVCLEAFQKDFEFQDIKTPAKALFNKEDYNSILQERDEKRRLLRLFWILTNNEKLLKDFLRVLDHYFKWLVAMVEHERSTPSINAHKYLDALRAISIQQHKHIDYNVHRMEPYVELRGALLKLRPGNYVMLCGELGAGKKWLTYDVCSEYVVLKAMDFKIFRLDLSQCSRPEEDLRMLRHLKKVLEHYSPYGMQPSPSPLTVADAVASSLSAGASTQICYRNQVDVAESIPNGILSTQLEIKHKLQSPEYKNCLLVLMNVPNKKAWSAFNLGCKMLILTRNTKLRDTLSPKLCQHIDLKGELTTAEFYKLFENYTRIDRSNFPKNCIALYESSEKNPYLLSLIAQNIKRRNNWDEWLENLQNCNINVNKFKAIIEISLNNLPNEYKDCYMKCAVFPHSTGMPIKLLAHLWNTNVQTAEDKLENLANFSMISKRTWDDFNITYELPFIYSLYFKNDLCARDEQAFIELHESVLDYYNLSHSFSDRLNSSHLDWYFYHCVGYHLKEAKHFEWFPKLFLNFHFLEQLIREIGLLNTIGHLIDYENYITNGDKRRLQLLRAIKEFLPKIQDKLVYSQDTCLLQYALMEKNGLIKTQAMRQVRKYPHNVWFEDKGKFHHRRQIFQLESQARQVVLIEEELVLIVLKNNDIILSDISLDYNKDPILIATDQRPDAKIIDVCLFQRQNYVLILNDYGELNLWSIEDQHQRSIVRRRNSKKKVYAQNFRKYLNKQDTGKWKQQVNTVIRGNAKIVAFVLREQLHVALDDGKLFLLEWHRDKAEFERSSLSVPPLKTKEQNIRVLTIISNTYYMLLTGSGEVSFWYLKDSSKVCSYLNWFEADDEFVCHEISAMGMQIHIVFVFRRKIMRLTIMHPDCISSTKLQPELLYTLEDNNNNEITCGRVTRNSQYIVLGTKHGLIVFDAFSKAEILRGNISEDISCVDVHTLDDPNFRYIIVCGTEKKHALYINGLRQINETSLAWAHDVNETLVDERSLEPQLEPNVRLCGHKKFAVASHGEKGCDLLAADTKNRIHQVHLDDDRAWSLINPFESEEPAKAISVLSCHNDNCFAAFENGDLFNIGKLELMRDFMSSAITMLNVIDDEFLVASTRNKTCIYNYNAKQKWVLASDCQYCVKVSEHHLVLILNHSRGLMLNLRDHKDGSFFDVAPYGLLGGCDYKNGCLYAAMTMHDVNIFKFAPKEGGGMWYHQIYPKHQHQIIGTDEDPLNNDDKTSSVSCLAASNNGELVAIGLASGSIKLYKFSSSLALLEEVFIMRSHESPINDLLFSPDGRVLISCGNQMCFWNVQYMLNNPLTRDNKRRGSTRFTSQHSSDIEDTDSSSMPRTNYLSVSTKHMFEDYVVKSFESITDRNANVEAVEEDEDALKFDWQDRLGTSRKPELYACIKFDGNHAERIIANPEFTEFKTIDDEGVYYNLTLLQTSGSHSDNGDDNDERALNENFTDSDIEGRQNYINGNGRLVYERHEDSDTVFT